MEKIAVNTSDVSTGKSTGEKVHLPLRCFLPLSGVNHGVGLIHLEEAQKKQWSLQIISFAGKIPINEKFARLIHGSADKVTGCTPCGADRDTCRNGSPT